MIQNHLGSLSFGATALEEGAVRFHVWAPFAKNVEVKLQDGGASRYISMTGRERGCFETIVEEVPTNARYFYRLNQVKERPDPYSRFQPEGVHGPSQIIDPRSFQWTCTDWKGIPLEDFIIYELHPGTFTREGTFEGILPYLDYLKNQLGVTAIEIMPVAQFPGKRNWGYDGVHLFSPQNSYGGPVGLKRLIDACHSIGLAVILDVVYNHLGHEGNHLRDFGPYFTPKYKTPWGEAINYDDAGSDFVRRYVIDNALYWIIEYQVDALRLDAIHAIYDFSAKHILRQMKEEVERATRSLQMDVYLIAESDLNDPKMIQAPDQGGDGLDAQWNDDFHHCLHTLLTREREGYYQDFEGLDQMAQAFQEGFVIAGVYSSYRDRIHGSPSLGYPSSKFVVFAQNHDQIGNRILGDRLSTLVPFEAEKLAAAVVLLSPYIPLLFMGEEYGETAPFQFFTDYQDPQLAEGVRRGRREEAAAFGWRGAIPDPQSEETFLRSKIDLSLRHQEPNALLSAFYKRLIRLRKDEATLRPGIRTIQVETWHNQKCLILQRAEGFIWIIFSFNMAPVQLSVHLPEGRWEKQLDSQEKPFGGEEGLLLPSIIQGDKKIQLHLAPYQTAVYCRR